MTEADDLFFSQDFVELGATVLRRAPGLNVADAHRRFRALFGASPNVFCVLWSLLCVARPPGSKPIHLLWVLMFLKVYATEHVHAALAGVGEKTYRKWQWIFVKLLASLQLVSNCMCFLFFHVEYNALAICEIGEFLRSASG